MPADRGGIRFVSSSIHWLLIFGSLVLLGSGWHMQHAELGELDRKFWLESHIFLGLSCGILFVARALLWTIRGPGAVLEGIPPWRQQIAGAINSLLYVSLAVVIVSGYFEAARGGRSMSYWGVPLPTWDAAGFIATRDLVDIHRLGAFAAGGLIGLHIALAGWNRVGRLRVATESPPRPRLEDTAGPDESRAERASETEQVLRVAAVQSEAEARQLAAIEKHKLFVNKTAKNLADNLRFFGWIEFWSQFVLALTIALLLAFASSGTAFSPSKAGFGDAIYWAYVGFAFLCPAVLLAFFYTRESRNIVASPTAYLLHDKRLAFWSLWVGLVLSQVGIFVSFVGVALSISLLVVKTISQPPGIAITDPNNIIRALDVFVLISNFMLLVAHFVGVVTALWLGFCVAKARVEYIAKQGAP
jgi:cytochrome b561